MRKTLFLLFALFPFLLLSSPIKGNLACKGNDFECKSPDTAFVEYIASTDDKQYIALDTIDYSFQPSLKVEFTLRISKYNDGCWGSGTGSGYNEAFYANFWRQDGCYYRIGNYSSNKITKKWNAFGINTIVMSKEYSSQNGEVLDAYSSNFTGIRGPLYIFARCRGYSGSREPQAHIPSACYGCRVWVNDNLIYDLVPQRITNENGENEGVLYDKISGTIFRNQGPGAFVIGPDL